MIEAGGATQAAGEDRIGERLDVGRAAAIAPVRRYDLADTLTLEVTTLRIGSKVQKMRGVASVEGQVTAEATITSIIADRPKEQ